MCVVAIVDADSLPVLATRQDPGDKLFLSWIGGRHGILAFSSVGQYYNEIRNNRAIMDLVGRYEQGGQLRKISSQKLAIAQNQVRDIPRQSNDVHILALALASSARVLCSNDADLRSDFRDRNILPNVGELRRVLYPVSGTHTRRRQFLNSHRCSRRQEN